MSTNRNEFRIRFENLNIVEASKRAIELKQEVMLESNVSARIEKDDSTNQDFGATLVLVLGAPAVIKIASGIAALLAKRRTFISIEQDGKLIAKGLGGADMARIAEAFGKK